MLIPFETMQAEVINGMKGGAGEAHLRSYADGQNKIMQLTLAPGAFLGLHTHEGTSEIVYVLSGIGTMLYDGTEEPLTPGVCHYCPMGHSHQLKNTGTEDLTVLGIVPTHEN